MSKAVTTTPQTAPTPDQQPQPSTTTGKDTEQKALGNLKKGLDGGGQGQPVPKKPKVEEGKPPAEVSGAADEELVASLTDPPGKIMLTKSQPPSLQLVSESAANRRLAKNFLFKMWKVLLCNFDSG